MTAIICPGAVAAVRDVLAERSLLPAVLRELTAMEASGMDLAEAIVAAATPHIAEAALRWAAEDCDGVAEELAERVGFWREVLATIAQRSASPEADALMRTARILRRKAMDIAAGAR